MEQDEFKAILDEATKGKPAAMSIILQIYDPLIKHYSYIHGRKDEDLKQHLTLHIIKKISKFKIEWGGSFGQSL